MIDTATNSVIGSIKVEDVYYVAVSPDGARLYVAGYTGDTMWAIDTATPPLSAPSHWVTRSRTSWSATTAAASTCWVRSSSGVTASSLNILDVAADAFTAVVTFPLGMEPTAITVAPDGARIYVTNSGNYTVTVLAQLHSVVGNPDLPDLVGKLFGGAAAGGGGWLVIGDHFFPIPPRPAPRCYRPWRMRWAPSLARRSRTMNSANGCGEMWRDRTRGQSRLDSRSPTNSNNATSAERTWSTCSPPSQRNSPTVKWPPPRLITRHNPPADSQRCTISTGSSLMAAIVVHVSRDRRHHRRARSPLRCPGTGCSMGSDEDRTGVRPGHP